MKTTRNGPTRREIKLEIISINAKIQAIERWLIDNTNHPDFIAKCRQRSILTTKLDEQNYMYRNAIYGKPAHGDTSFKGLPLKFHYNL